MIGQEWVIDARACSPKALQELGTLQGLFEQLIEQLGLLPLGRGQWHVFEGHAGITGLQMLSESHLAIHSFPELGYAALSVYSCKPCMTPDFEALLKHWLGARELEVNCIVRSCSALKKGCDIPPGNETP